MASLWELFVKVSGDNSNYKQSMKESQDVTTQFGDTFTKLDAKLLSSIGFASLGAGAAAAGKFIFDTAVKFEDANFTIQRATGATGASLDGLERSMGSLYLNSAKSANEIAAVLSQLTIRTGLTGAGLEELAQHSLNFAKVSGSDLVSSVKENERLFQQWGVATADQSAALDVLYVASQKTGQSTTEISAALAVMGPSLRAFGFDFLDATALVGTFAKAGLNAEDMVKGLNTMFKTFATAGKDPKQALADLIEKLGNASTSTQAFNELIENGFSKKAAVAMADAALKGALNIEEFRKVLVNARGEVDKTAQATDGFLDKLTKLWHGIEDLTKGPATALLSFLGSYIDLVNKAEKGTSGWQKALDFITGAGQVKTVLGYASDKFGGLIGGGLSAGFGNAFGAGGSTGGGPVNIPIKSLGTPDKTGGGGLTPTEQAELTKKLFSTVGMEDYKEELAKVTQAFNELTAAGKLTVTQQEQVRDKIQKLKDEIADYRTVFTSLADAKPFTGQLSILRDLSVQQLTLSEQAKGNAKAQLDYIEAYKKSADYARNLGEQWIYSLSGITVAEQDASRAAKTMDDEAKKLAVTLPSFDTKALKEVTDQLQLMGVFGPRVPPEIQKISDALKTLGIGNSRDDVAKLNAAFDGLNLALKTGAISQNEYDRGFVNYVDDLKKEGVQIDANTRKIYDQIKAHLENLKAVQEFGDQTKAIFKGAFEGVEHDFADMVTTANFSFDSMAKTGQKFASDLFSMMLKSLFKPIEDAFAQLGQQIGKALGSIWSSTPAAGQAAANAASTGANAATSGAQAASSGASGAAGAAASSLTGVLGAIGSIGSFITGVVGDIQNIHTNNLLGEIEVSTRGSLNEALNLRADLWSQYGHMYDRLGEVVNSIRSGGSGGGNTFNFYNADLQDVMRELKLAGVLPS